MHIGSPTERDFVPLREWPRQMDEMFNNNVAMLFVEVVTFSHTYFLCPNQASNGPFLLTHSPGFLTPKVRPELPEETVENDDVL